MSSAASAVKDEDEEIVLIIDEVKTADDDAPDVAVEDVPVPVPQTSDIIQSDPLTETAPDTGKKTCSN